MAATNEPAGQQAMTSERLAVIERHLRSANNDISRNREETVDILRYSRDVTALLAEVERLRAALDVAALAVQSEHDHLTGYREVTQAAITRLRLTLAAKEMREAALLAVVRAVAEAIQYEVATVRAADIDRSIVGHGYMACVSPTIQEQARALVASAGDGEQGEA